MELGPSTPPLQTVDSSDWDYAYTEESVQLDHDEQLLAYTDQIKPGRALDLGCGTGGNSVELARRGWSVVGVDIASKPIEVARTATDPSLEIRYEVGDMTVWESGESFDLVLISYAFPPSGPKRSAAVATAVKALAPAGTLVTAEFDASSMSFGKPSDFSTVEETTSSLSTLEIVSVEAIPTKPHEHGDLVSHSTEETPMAVIAVAKKPAS